MIEVEELSRRSLECRVLCATQLLRGCSAEDALWCLNDTTFRVTDRMAPLFLSDEGQELNGGRLRLLLFSRVNESCGIDCPQLQINERLVAGVRVARAISTAEAIEFLSCASGKYIRALALLAGTPEREMREYISTVSTGGDA